MAEFVQLIVQVDKSQLSSLQAEVQKIKGQIINVNVKKDGVDSAQKSVKDLGQATKETTGLTKLLGASLDQIVAKMVAWQLIGAGVASVIRSFKDAIATMKEVDSALVTVRKTTGFTEAQIAALTDKTYELASAYGRTADELLNLSANFARAGLGDQLEEMTELAALLQNVGDLEGETASKFILAANAAWQLGGNYDRLMEIIDGMNAVTNQAAVDMEALTTGITVAGSVFANAGESAKTYTALVGTGVAATQRSGAEVARGLRTIAMNIRAIKGELEDGEIIDEKTISDAAKALSSVGVSIKDNVTGELRLTSEVLRDLAGRWGDLTTAEQSYLAQSLAGKRQANVLTALMQNWAEAERQMVLYANGAGSALSENEIYLNSWEAKSKQLTAAWTEFLSHLIETDAIKGALDLMTGLVNVLDSGVGGVIAVTVAIVGIGKAFSSFAASAAADALTLTVAFFRAEASVLGLGAAVESLTASMLANPLFLAASAGAAIYLAIRAVNEQTHSYEEQADILDGINEKYTDAKSELDALKSKTEALTVEESKRLNVLKDEVETLKEQAEFAKRVAVRNWDDQQYGTVVGAGVGAFGEYRSGRKDKTAEQVKEASDAFRDLRKEYQQGQMEAGEFNKELNGIVASLETSVEAVRLKKEVTGDLTESERALLALYERLSKAFKAVTEEEEKAAAASEDYTGRLKSHAEIYEEVSEKANVLIAAMNEMDTAGGMTEKTMQALVAQFPELMDQLTLTEKGWVLNRQAIEEHYKALLADYQLTLDKAKNAATALIEAETGKKVSIDATTAAIKNQLAALALLYEARFVSRRVEQGDSYSDAMRSYNTGASAEFQAAAKAREAARSITTAEANISTAQGVLDAIRSSSGSTGKTSTGSKSSSKSKETAEEAAEATADMAEQLAQIVSLRKSELDFLDKSGAELAEQNAKIREIQAALHDEAEYIRSTAAYQEAIRQAAEDESKLTKEQVTLLTKVRSLSAEWWSYQDKITKSLKDAADNYLEKIKKGIEAIKNAVQKTLDKQEEAAIWPLQEQLDLLKAQRDAARDAREEEEKRLAVEEARIALENAQKERNIRIYNASTGQWEWAANAETVDQAQKSLLAAQQSLSDYYEDQEIKRLEQQIEDIRKRFERIEESVETIADKIKAGVEKSGGIGNYLKEAGAGSAIVGFGNLADRLLGGEYSSGSSKSGAKTIGDYKNDYEAARARGDADGMAAANAGANAIRAQMGKPAQDASADIAAVRAGIYDGGGILRGVGGIKATAEDEMILPPDITRAMLTAQKGGGFEGLLRNLGIVTSAAQGYAGVGGTVTKNSIGEQHNGDVYYFNGMEIRNVTENTTIGEFVRRVKTLPLYSGGG